MLSGKKFIELVRCNRPDMDDRLAEIFEKNMQNSFQRGFTKAWFITSRLREFSRKNRAKFLDELNLIKEKLLKNGLSGDFLDKEAMKRYMIDK